jgi:hypothetical protein
MMVPPILAKNCMSSSFSLRSAASGAPNLASTPDMIPATLSHFLHAPGNASFL